MYRIEVATGEEAVFRTVEELATGIRNGLITPRSRIYHAASQKWLPIEFHPHYKKAVDQVTGGAPMIDTGLTKPAPRRTPAPVPAPAPAPAPRPEPWRAVSAPAPEARRPSPPAPVPAPAPLPPPPAPAERPSSYLPPEPPRTEVVEAEVVKAVVEAAPAATALIEPTTEDLELPCITYPDVPPPAEPAHPVARRRATPRATLLIAAAVGLTALGGYLVNSRDSVASATPAAPVSESPADEDREMELDSEGAFPEDAAVTPAPATAIPAPAPVPSKRASPPASIVSPSAAVAAPKTLAPQLTPAPRPSGPVSQAWSSSAGAIAPLTPPPAAPAPVTAAAGPAIAPLPAAIDLSLPKLPSAETIGVAAEAKRDSAAMKRILRAVSGKPAGGKAGQQ